jgi:uncharacterized protein with FMN-binding domain
MIRLGRIFLSGGLILVSGAYAWWEQGAPPDTTQPTPAAARQVPSPVPPAVSAANPPPAAPSRPVPPQQTAAPPVAEDAPEPVAKAKAPRTKIATAEPALQPAAPPPPAPPEVPLQAVQLAPPPMVSTGRYADGEFIGNAVDGEWGPVQVKAVIRNGDIADVICIEFPIHRERSAEISEWAIPQLYQEAIKAQSADIDMVSQASFTSEEYQQSLASALARAHK